MSFQLRASFALVLLATSPSCAEAPSSEVEPPKTEAEAAPASVAEQVTRLQRSIEAAEEHLRERKAERDDPSSEYAQAQAAFEQDDAAFEAQKKTVKAQPEEDAAGRAEAEAEVVRLERARKLAKDRFDLAIEDRKVSAEQIANLEQKQVRDRQVLDKLEGRGTPAPASTDPAAASAAASAAATIAAGSAPGAQAASTPATNPIPASTTPAPVPSATAEPAPAAVANAQPAGAAPAVAVVPVVVAEVEDKPSQELIEAQQDAVTKTAASKEADDEAKSITERLQSLDTDIALEQKLLVTARKQRDNATENRAELTNAFRERSLSGAPRAELDGLLAQVKSIEARLKKAGHDVQEHSVRLEELQSERSGLQAEQIAALRKAEEAHEQVEVAQDEIKRLENPFSPRNVLQWLIDHGPRMLTIFFALLVGHWFSKLFSHRVIRLLAHSGARGSSVEREDRTQTLVGVFHNAASMAIFVGGGLMILQEAGIPIAPLLGGAAVFGLAIAFGAQNLIRDYFYGFVILIENQYKLNDVVQIGDRSGQVEKITLRMTVLRDLEGRVHFLPNGEVTAVTNFTHGWSRAMFDIGVAYKEQVDRVISVLMALAREIRADPLYGPMILEDATMLGVDSLADSAVVIKFYIKTRPLQQWNVKRELLRRIKNRFDEIGIEIPFPQRTVYHRVEPGTALADSLTGPSQAIQGHHSHLPST